MVWHNDPITFNDCQTLQNQDLTHLRGSGIAVGAGAHKISVRTYVKVLIKSDSIMGVILALSTDFLNYKAVLEIC